MERRKKDPDGREVVECLKDTPANLPEPQGEAEAEKAVPPDQGGGVEIENTMLTLPEHPAGEGWLFDPIKPEARR